MNSAAPHDATAHVLGELRVGGDWAIAHGDFAALRHVAGQLARHLPGAALADLAALAEACVTDPDRASRLWHALRVRLLA
jgi:hypothetical protein